FLFCCQVVLKVGSSFSIILLFIISFSDKQIYFILILNIRAFYSIFSILLHPIIVFLLVINIGNHIRDYGSVSFILFGPLQISQRLVIIALSVFDITRIIASSIGVPVVVGLNRIELLQCFFELLPSKMGVGQFKLSLFPLRFREPCNIYFCQVFNGLCVVFLPKIKITHFIIGE